MKSTALYYQATVKIIGCCFFVLTGLGLHAQTRGTVEVLMQDSRIDTLLARRMQPPKATTYTQPGVGANNITVDGYRVQIFSGTSRADAYAAQDKFQKRHPELHTYIIYREPNFKVRAGDFRTRMEATRLQQELRPVYPSLFIIPDKINPALNVQNQ